MSNSNQNNNNPASGNAGDTSPKKKGWILWVLVALAALIMIFMFRGCSRKSELANQTASSTISATTPSAKPGSVGILLPAGTSGVASFLAGTENLPRTFVFEKLNFDTNKSEIRAADQAELDLLAAALKQHPNARVRIVGYADARGSAASNLTLGKMRADSVKAALVSAGIAADRLETESGGEAAPVDSNSTTAGQAENRRTELVVLQR